QQVKDYLAAIVNTGFFEHRICACVLKPTASEATDIDVPMEMQVIPWHYESLFSESGVMLSIFNQFSSYPDEVLVIYESSVFFEPETATKAFNATEVHVMTALPKLLYLLMQENSSPWKFYGVMLKQPQNNIVSETVSGMFEGLLKGFQNIEKNNGLICSIIEDQSGMIPLFASFCTKIFNAPQIDSKHYVFNGKTGLFGRL
ncbi:MAG TPA: hypothetical protein PLV76_02620, partial [Spirochaetales bacterium]|nr:hypothetical protein [Spirochaetales bacterium]